MASKTQLAENGGVETEGILPIQEPFFVTAKFWKRFSVYISVSLSIVSLIISAIASLKPGNADHLKALTVTSIVINSISVGLSALTSLDWQSQATTDRKFAQMLREVAHVHEGTGVVVLGKRGVERLERMGVDVGGSGSGNER
ncbi:hypothetical protein CJF32_00007724 [Rutstroemia sp. NJR-2017a WRK4]|nr:hypothetical protein CJF32_00007724 [Rutstroemia sp. NJR-2017a WRK4]